MICLKTKIVHDLFDREIMDVITLGPNIIMNCHDYETKNYENTLCLIQQITFSSCTTPT